MSVRLGIVLLVFSLVSYAESARILRFPDIHQNQVVFVHAGDIYRANVQGGQATRLTTHEGFEAFPKFSPDGSMIAFSAEYNGTRQVYTMPTQGGLPQQLTWYNDVGPMPPRGGFDYRVLDWTADGKHVLVRANRLPWGPRMGRFYLVPVAGGMEKALEIPEAGGGMLSPDGKQVVFTLKDREFRTWKRYRGGRAQDIWTYDLAAGRSKRLTDHPATDHQPLWVGDHIYFTSDRDYTLNLYRHQPDGEPLAVTEHQDFDVLWASAGPQAIVYENGGWLYRFDPQSNASQKLEFTLPGDSAGKMSRFVSASDFINSQSISPGGERVVFAARGEIFTVPAKNGQIRNISQSPQAREIDVSWSPDGRWIAYLSDATGEYEIYLRSHDGLQAPKQITKNGRIWRFAPIWSPDSKKLAFSDKQQQLQIVDVESGRLTVADRSGRNDIQDYSWAPDSAHLAYVKLNQAGTANIWVYALGTKQATQLTDDDSSEFNPVFDPAGRYLYFLSNRDYNLTFSDYEFNYLYTDATRVYAGLINADAPALKRPKNDEVMLDSGSTDEDTDQQSEKLEFELKIVGFNQRVVALNDTGGNFGNLSATKSGLFFTQNDNGDSKLQFFDLDKEKISTVLKGVSNYQIAAKGEKILFRKGSHFGIAEAKPDQDADKGKLDLSEMQVRVTPTLEWSQMYTDAWRILRDWFYDPNMHGMDWQAIHDKYQPLVQHVSHRSDLDYIFGEIAGEMNAGHIYVQNGDQPRVERRQGGLLGADITASDEGFKIDRIFPGEAWHESFRSPLAEPGTGIQEGDFILAVDGVSVKTVRNFYQLLENKGGDVVSLSIGKNATDRNPKQVLVKTITSETNLRYLDWVQTRRRMVEELSDGQVGYIHLPNTAQDGNRELFKAFLPQTDKAALIIDDRYNGGGFIPDRMIELVARKSLNYWKRRGLDPQSTPLVAHNGPKAVLINGLSSSGGDAFPYYFRKLGLGPLIGTRTWGGLIGISGNPMLVDGGGILASTFRFLDTDGNWAVENEGVAPDIEVIDRPELVAQGRDPSLERAVDYLLEALKQNPPSEITVPPAPTKFGQ